jgi:hypothetical protein
MIRRIAVLLISLLAAVLCEQVLPRLGAQGTDESFAPAGAAAIVHVSHIGYRPGDEKWAVVELPGKTSVGTARLERLVKKKWRRVAILKPGLRAFAHGETLARFDFTATSREGVYRLAYGRRLSVAFTIGNGVLNDIYADTISQFFSGQMCHIALRMGEEVRHGICHVDDAAQAPPNKIGPDFYRSFESTETGLAPGTHIPVNYGGWHDAGDYDLNVSSHAFTLLLLSWAAQDMRARADLVSVDFVEQRVKYGEGNGIPDIEEQIRWGAEWLLRVQREDGGVPIGVVEVSKKYYGLYRMPDKITDGAIGTGDDRELYTNAVSPNQLKFAAAMASASTALQKRYPLIAARCRAAAERAWQFYRSRPEVWRPTPYNTDPTFGKEGMILAAVAELFMATGKEEYRERLLSSARQIEEMDRWHLKYMEPSINWFALPHMMRAARRLPQIDGSVRKGLERWHEAVLDQERGNAFGIDGRFEATEWGISIRPMGIGVIYSLAERHYPGIVGRERAARYFRFLFGMHQGPDYSFVVGKGARHPLYPHSAMLSAAYGKRPGGISGAVVPGVRLSQKTGRVEYRDKRDLWAFNEPTISAGALFVYHALAVEGKWK